jgi:nicotinamide-nucleotide amidase
VALSGAARVVVVVAPGAPGAPADVDALALTLEGAGFPVACRTLVECDEADLERALVPGAPLTVVVAGADGSEGDLVRRVVARATATRLVLHDRVLSILTVRHQRIDRPLPRAAERQALLPQGAVVWDTDGGAPAWAVESDRGIVAVLPRGIEMRSTIDRDLAPFVRPRWPGLGTALARLVRTAGVTAADIEERLGDRVARPVAGAPGEATASVVGVDGEVWVRVQAKGATPEAAAATLAAAETSLVEALGDDCYGRDDERLEQVVGRLLLERRLTLSVAESCTGGLLSERLTGVDGSSVYFERGVVAYSNRAKQEVLGVPEELLRIHGAVSAPCVEAMVQGICARSGSDCGLAVTGIAGPEGGTPVKPVGTVFVGVSVVGGGVEVRRFTVLGDRRAVNVQAAVAALDLLRRRLMALGPGQ